MGNFSTDNGHPGIPLDPGVFEQAENFKADWVEIEFETPKGSSLITHRCSIIGMNACIYILLTCPNTELKDCRGICGQVLAKAKVEIQGM
jgi:hypothetical protein